MDATTSRGHPTTPAVLSLFALTSAARALNEASAIVAIAGVSPDVVKVMCGTLEDINVFISEVVACKLAVTLCGHGPGSYCDTWVHSTHNWVVIDCTPSYYLNPFRCACVHLAV